MSDVRIRDATNTAMARKTTTIRPPATAITVVEDDDDGHSVPVSGAPTTPPRYPAELT